MVKTVCYKKEKTWKSRKEAMAFFFKGMISCDGCEAERYMKIYSELAMGLDYCTDDPDMFGDHKITESDLECMMAEFA